MRPTGPRKGFAFVLLGWLLVLLTFTLAQVLDGALADRRFAARSREKLRATLAARAGVETAIAELALANPEGDLLTDEWAAESPFHLEAAVGDARPPAASFTLIGELAPGGRTPVHAVLDEERLPNALTAPDLILRHYSELSKVEYLALARVRAGLPGGRPRAAAMLYPTIRSLLGAPGMTASAFYGEDWDEDGALDPNEDGGPGGASPPDNGDGRLDRGLLNAVSVLGDGRLNLNTASRSALEALRAAIPAFDATKFLRARAARPAAYFTLADVVNSAGLSPLLIRPLGALAKLRSSYFRVVSVGKARVSARTARAEAVIRRGDSRLEVEYYRED